MPGIIWKFVDKSKKKIFWSATSDSVLYLGQLLIDFDFIFNLAINENTEEFELTQEQNEFLMNGVEIRLDHLIKNIDQSIPNDLTALKFTFKGKSHKLYVRMSRNHRLIASLIVFYDFLGEAKATGKKIKVQGGVFEKLITTQ